jgi:hypothetical protein
LTKMLEVRLGPDTGDLALRVGMHSGQVTAGVLRGDKSRFQLFGDTMNTASRIESTGERNRVHMSSETAALLMAQGKKHWVREREDTVHAKGKGEMKTYWLEVKAQSSPSARSGASNEGSESTDNRSALNLSSLAPLHDTKKMVSADKASRLVAWNVDIMGKVLKEIAKRRSALGTDQLPFEDPEDTYGSAKMVINEVKEIITLPRFDKGVDNGSAPVELDSDVVDQLRDYVSTVSSLYR